MLKGTMGRTHPFTRLAATHGGSKDTVDHILPEGDPSFGLDVESRITLRELFCVIQSASGNYLTPEFKLRNYRIEAAIPRVCHFMVSSR